MPKGAGGGAGTGAGAGCELYGSVKDNIEQGGRLVEMAYDDYCQKKIKTLQRFDRVILSDIKTRKNVLIYLSGDSKAWEKSVDGFYLGMEKYNGCHIDRNNNAIVCRHLAFEWLKRHKVRSHLASYRSTFFSQERIKSVPELWDNIYDIKKVSQCADHIVFAETESNGLGRSLSHLCKKMKCGEVKYALLFSENHAMAIVVQRKYDNIYVVKFYDPNSTLVHVRAVCEDLEAISTLGLNDFIPKNLVERYFPKNKVLSLALYDHLVIKKLNNHTTSEVLRRKPVNMVDLYVRAKYVSDCLYHALFFCRNKFSASLVKNLAVYFSGLSEAKKNQLVVRWSQYASPLLIRASLYGCLEVVSFLLRDKLGVNVNGGDCDGVNALFVAAEKGYVAIVKALLIAGADVDLATNDGFTPLCIAAQNGHADVVEKLLAAGADVNRVLSHGVSALCIAAQNGHEAVVEKLLAAGADVSHVLSGGVNALYFASQNGHAAIVKALLIAGADVNHVLSNGINALYIAAQNGHEAIVEKLLAVGADVNQARMDIGVSPLYMAAQNGHTIVVEKLLAAGAAVNQAHTDSGSTPLCVAAQNGHEAVVAKLLAAGAAANQARTDNGVTPLYLAAQNGYEAVVEKLLATGVAVNQARTDIGVAPLYAAALNGHEAVVEKLLAAGAGVNQARTDNGVTPLYAAALNGYEAVVEKLLAAGAVVNQACTDDGSTPLYAAAQKGHEAVVAKLLAAGADVNQARTDSGSTPLYVAAFSGQEAVVEKLLVAGANVNQVLFLALKNSHAGVVGQLVDAGATVDVEAVLGGKKLIDWMKALGKDNPCYQILCEQIKKQGDLAPTRLWMTLA